jgi:2-polyprenyl-3-methyl-5-hydroxy-6-metoxy-1,4-benzoquinol methylase
MDFGAGRGAMALALRENGADVVAVDPFGHRYLRDVGLVAFADLGALPPDLCFDGIVSLEVMEHLLEPGETLAKLHERLRPGGWLFITTPNPAGLLARLSGERWREAAKPGHVLFFSPTTLRGLLKVTDFCDTRRLRWLLRYPGVSTTRSALHYVLQAVLLDGSLRYLAYKKQFREGTSQPASWCAWWHNELARRRQSGR